MDNPKANEKKYGVQRKTLKALGDLKNVLESRTVITQLKQLADDELAHYVNLILDLPDEHPNWGQNIAALIGAAKTHRTYSELYTIKEK